jgi:hypothetical protein
MRTIIEVYQHQADECARLAKETDDPKRRETFLKLADDWTKAIQRGLMTQEGGFRAAPIMGRRGAVDRKPPSGVHRCDFVDVSIAQVSQSAR